MRAAPHVCFRVLCVSITVYTINCFLFFIIFFMIQGLKGMFALSLEGDEGSFTVEPSIVRDSSDFIIKVKNSALLDFEQRQVIEFKVGQLLSFWLTGLKRKNMEYRLL